MELPHIGTHCEEPTCHLLDFLPFTCNLCKKRFCVEHHQYAAHNCSESHRADVQVPICPLCGHPVPSRPGQAPDLAVNEHLENNCTNKKKKIYTNRCSASGCKTREMIPVRCTSCHLNYCLRHRHPHDHQCQPAAASRTRVLAVAQARASAKPSSKKQTNHNSTENGGLRGGIQRFLTPAPGTPTPTGHTTAPQQPRQHNLSTLQGGMSEDEALSRAMAASVQDTGQSKADQVSAGQNTDDEDTQLAQAIAASLEVSGQPSSNSSNSCVLS